MKMSSETDFWNIFINIIKSMMILSGSYSVTELALNLQKIYRMKDFQKRFSSLNDHRLTNSEN